MDITNSNFVDCLPTIAECIKECDFIAIDTEMSGLLREKSNNIFDIPEDRFSKHVASSRGYFIMQFGLSCFKRSSTSIYDNKTYNFYIFPQANEELGADINRTFSLQANAIQFLSKNNFDFNKLFKDGVSYLTFEEKKALTVELKVLNKTRSHLSEQAVKNDVVLPGFVPANLSSICKNWVKKAKKFIESEKLKASSGEASGDVVMDTNQSESKALPSQAVLEFQDCCTSQKRKTLRKLLECQPFWTNIDINERENFDSGDTYLTLSFIEKADKEERERKALVKAKGFLEILEIIVKERKPLVGHNLILDLIQMITQFIEPLQDDYSCFKEICHELFPVIYDTKFIAHSILDPDTLSNNQSRLEELYNQLRESESLPRIQVNCINEFTSENQHPHQAGYDAYMSGYSFLVLAEAYMDQQRRYKKKELNHSDVGLVSIVSEREVVDEFANKIHLAYSYDFKHFNLAKDESMPDRSHIFYVKHPNTWRLEDLYGVFSGHGGVTVSMLNNTSSLCALRDTKYKDAALQLVKKSKSTNSNHKIFTYDYYLEHHRNEAVKKVGLETTNNAIDIKQ